MYLFYEPTSNTHVLVFFDVQKNNEEVQLYRLIIRHFFTKAQQLHMCHGRDLTTGQRHLFHEHNMAVLIDSNFKFVSGFCLFQCFAITQTLYVDILCAKGGGRFLLDAISQIPFNQGNEFTLKLSSYVEAFPFYLGQGFTFDEFAHNLQFEIRNYTRMTKTELRDCKTEILEYVEEVGRLHMNLKRGLIRRDSPHYLRVIEDGNRIADRLLMTGFDAKIRAQTLEDPVAMADDDQYTAAYAVFVNKVIKPTATKKIPPTGVRYLTGKCPLLLSFEDQQALVFSLLPALRDPPPPMDEVKKRKLYNDDD